MPSDAFASFPAFFDEAPAIRLQDPLAEFLGAVREGLLEYRYAHAVEFAGHSCLLAFGAPIATQLRFTRLDTGASAGVSADLKRVPDDARVAELMPLCLRGLASPQEQEAFRAAWQERVRRLLLQHADDPEVIVLQPPGDTARAEGPR